MRSTSRLSPMNDRPSAMERIDELRKHHLASLLLTLDNTVVHGSPAGSSLIEMTHYHLETGGKRLRALLPLAVAECLGAPAESMIPFGAACEILHNATLVHDDLQDGDRVRRGAETIWVKYGEARAINLGDAMLYYTLMLVRQLNGTAEQREALGDRILRETVRVIDGQEREFLLQSLDKPSWETYITMVEGKTSGLFSLPIAGAAAFLGADETLVDALADAAGHLGVIFQIQDDVLDIFGEKGRDRRGSDVAEGKISALVVHTLHNAEPDDAAWLRALLRKDRDLVTDAEIDRAAHLFQSSGALRFSLDEIDRRASLASQNPVLAQYPDVQRLIADMAELFVEPIANLRKPS